MLNKPYAQIKDLKLYCPDDLENIKHNHKTTWQVFKAFNLKVYQNLPINFAKPHIENWCNGWEIRRHFFAYYKYDSYLGNAPIIALILNRNRLVICLTWHSYKAKVSNSSLQNFNTWTDKIYWENYSEFYVWHSSVDYYGDFQSVREFDDDKMHLKDGEFYRLGRFIHKDELDKFNDDELINWTRQTIEQLSGVYEYCH
ncbi:MAG: HI_0552 family protein [Moraxella equi]|nr:HI_0552 family protein [Moraxella equi]